MQNQIEQQRNNMNQTTRSVAEDEISLVESEIAAQREMLKEADSTLNNILNKMEDDVVDVSERDPGTLQLSELSACSFEDEWKYLHFLKVLFIPK